MVTRCGSLNSKKHDALRALRYLVLSGGYENRVQVWSMQDHLLLCYIALEIDLTDYDFGGKFDQ